MRKIILGLCSYRYIEISTCSDVFNLIGIGLIHDWIVMEGTLVTLARNGIINQIYKHKPDYTHLLFIDADQSGFGKKDLKALIDADKDIIAGITLKRNPPHHLTFNPLEEHKDLTTQIIEVDFTGMFFTLIKREVIEACSEWHNGKRIVFTGDRCLRPTFDIERKQMVELLSKSEDSLETKLDSAIDFGMNCHRNGSLQGEDVEFCRRARSKGFKCYVHMGVRINHVSERILKVDEDGEFEK